MVWLQNNPPNLLEGYDVAEEERWSVVIEGDSF